jgi:2-methylcitrate dehydratase PrpD
MSKPLMEDVLAEYIHNLRWDNLPEEVVKSAKLFFLDYLASAIAGYKINRVYSDAMTKLYSAMSGKPESSVLFHDLKLPAPNAALLNGFYGHGADIDDGQRTANGHPGIVVIPAVLAMAEAEGLSGKDVIMAMVAGYDIFVRMASAANPSHFNRGFHSTGTIGTIASGGAVAKVLSLDAQGVRNALSLAAIQAAGIHEISESGQAAKPLSPGKAAYGGVLAGRMAQMGLEGPREALEGEKGFIKAFTDSFDFAKIEKDLGKDFKITSCYVKLYPGCRHTHAAVDVAVKLHKTGPVSPDLIEKIYIHTYPASIRITGSIFEPSCENEAKFSLPYSVATGLVKGDFTLDDLDVTRSFDPKVREMVRKIEIISDPQLENRAANIRGARVELVFKDGSRKEAGVVLPKGDPEIPVTRKDIENKLAACAKGEMTAEKQAAIIKAVWELEKMTNLDDLSRLLRF